MEKKSLGGRIFNFLSSPIKTYSKTVSRSFNRKSLKGIIPSEYFDKEKMRSTIELAFDAEAQKPSYSFKVAMAREGLDENDLEKGHGRLMFFNQIIFLFGTGITLYSAYYISSYIGRGFYSFAVFSAISMIFSILYLLILYLKHSWLAFRIRNMTLLTFMQWLFIVIKAPDELMPLVKYTEKCHLIDN